MAVPGAPPGLSIDAAVIGRENERIAIRIEDKAGEKSEEDG